MIAGNPGLDFFEQNPTLAYKTEARKLIEEYGDETASKVAWAVYMVEHPESPLFKIPLDERIEEVKLNYGIDVRDYEEFRSAFALIAMSKEAALYKIHVEKLEELTMHLKTLDLTDDKDSKKYLDILKNLPKIWQGLEKVKSNMIEQQNKKGIYGGASRSAREKRE